MLSAKYGFPPEVIMKMTLSQQDMYLNENTSKESGIKMFGTRAEANAFLNELNEEK